MTTADLLIEPTDIFPELGQVVAAVRARDWPALEAFFAGIPDPSDHCFAVGIAASVKGTEEFFDRVVAERPRSVLARTLLAEQLITIGWDIRTAARASQVSREQFEGLYAYLRRAEQHLIEATALEP